MQRSGVFLKSLSHTRITDQPSRRSVRLTRWSRATLRSILSTQYRRLWMPLHLRLKRGKSTILPLPAVPKISVHEHRNLASSEHEIGFADDAWCAHSEPETETVESASQVSLRLSVCAANTPHRAGDNSRIPGGSLYLRHHSAIVVRPESIAYILWDLLSTAPTSAACESTRDFAAKLGAATERSCSEPITQTLGCSSTRVRNAF